MRRRWCMAEAAIMLTRHSHSTSLLGKLTRKSFTYFRTKTATTSAVQHPQQSTSTITSILQLQTEQSLPDQIINHFQLSSITNLPSKTPHLSAPSTKLSHSRRRTISWSARRCQRRRSPKLLLKRSKCSRSCQHDAKLIKIYTKAPTLVAEMLLRMLVEVWVVQSQTRDLKTCPGCHNRQRHPLTTDSRS